MVRRPVYKPPLRFTLSESVSCSLGDATIQRLKKTQQCFQPDRIDLKNLRGLKKSSCEELVSILAHEHDESIDKDAVVELEWVRLALTCVMQPSMNDKEAVALLAPMLGLGKKKKKDEDTGPTYTDKGSVDLFMISARALHRNFMACSTIVDLWIARCAYDKLHGEGDHGNDEEACQGVVAKAQLSRQDLLAWCSYTVHRDDAFIALPRTSFLFMLFLFMVHGHLRIFPRGQVKLGLESWVPGQDIHTDLDHNVDSLDSFWGWVMSDSGLQREFGLVKNYTHGGTVYPRCILANKQTLIGGVKMTQDKFDGSSTSQWLLQHKIAQSVLATQPTAFLSAAMLVAVHLTEEEDWSDEQVSYVSMAFITYDERSRFFALTTVAVHFDVGIVKPRVSSEVVSMEAFVFETYTGTLWDFPGWLTLLSDMLYIAFMSYLFCLEFRDMTSAARFGLDELKDYFGFWNTADWLQILIGATTVISIGGITWVVMISDIAMKRILLDDHFLLKGDVMNIDIDTMEEIEHSLIELIGYYKNLRYFFVLVMVTLVLKFFKSFRANARLKVITNTFRRMSVDFIHFTSIFLTIFLPLLVLGHVLFGGDIDGFGSVLSSLNVGWQAIMGEFGWYADLGAIHWNGVLPSGVPKIFVECWYVIVVFLVLLTLLNMLLAVVLEHYTFVHNAVKSIPDAPAIWVQTGRYFRVMKETKGYMELSLLLMALEDDDNPAHPADIVDTESLMEAFGGMTYPQACWIICYIRIHRANNIKRDVVDLDDLIKAMVKNDKKLVGVIRLLGDDSYDGTDYGTTRNSGFTQHSDPKHPKSSMFSDASVPGAEVYGASRQHEAKQAFARKHGQKEPMVSLKLDGYKDSSIGGSPQFPGVVPPVVTSKATPTSTQLSSSASVGVVLGEVAELARTMDALIGRIVGTQAEHSNLCKKLDILSQVVESGFPCCVTTSVRSAGESTDMNGPRNAGLGHGLRASRNNAGGGAERIQGDQHDSARERGGGVQTVLRR